MMYFLLHLGVRFTANDQISTLYSNIVYYCFVYYIVYYITRRSIPTAHTDVSLTLLPDHDGNTQIQDASILEKD